MQTMQYIYIYICELPRLSWISQVLVGVMFDMILPNFQQIFF